MLTVRISPDLARIKADPHRLEQVITNLLSNASKYSGENQEIIFRARDLGGILEIEVEDRGIGISLQEQQRLFEPYHRVEQDRQRFSGLGLGLAVSRQIIEAHGGRLTVTSEVGRGSIFKFTVPLDEVSDKDPSTLQPSLK
jgi:signal transduction histidine kinase